MNKFKTFIISIILLSPAIDTAFANDSSTMAEYKKISVEMNVMFKELYALEKKALMHDGLYAMKQNLGKAKSKYKSSMVKISKKNDPKAEAKFKRYNELKSRQKALQAELIAIWSGEAEVDQLTSRLSEAKKELGRLNKDLVNLRKMPSADPKVNTLKTELSGLQDKSKNDTKLSGLKEKIAKAKSDYQKKLNSAEIKKYKDKISKAQADYNDELKNSKNSGIRKEIAEKAKALDLALIDMLKRAAAQHNEKFSTPEDLKTEIARLTKELKMAKQLNAKGRKIRNITGEMKDIIRK
ncbi:MAG: coiled-coil domain-containing protein [Planctomycetota bacterium]|jgi:hypothetical protein